MVRSSPHACIRSRAGRMRAGSRAFFLIPGWFRGRGGAVPSGALRAGVPFCGAKIRKSSYICLLGGLISYRAVRAEAGLRGRGVGKRPCAFREKRCRFLPEVLPLSGKSGGTFRPVPCGRETAGRPPPGKRASAEGGGRRRRGRCFCINIPNSSCFCRRKRGDSLDKTKNPRTFGAAKTGEGRWRRRRAGLLFSRRRQAERTENIPLFNTYYFSYE